jgi:hypothetical protein
MGHLDPREAKILELWEPGESWEPGNFREPGELFGNLGTWETVYLLAFLLTFHCLCDRHVIYYALYTTTTMWMYYTLLLCGCTIHYYYTDNTVC